MNPWVALATAPATLAQPRQELARLTRQIAAVLGASNVLGLIVWLLVLLLALKLYERGVTALIRARMESGQRLGRWRPMVRLATGVLALLLTVHALTPNHPWAQSVVLVGVVIALLWAGRDVIRNATAGAVVIAGRTIEPGDFLRIGQGTDALEGRVVSIAIRGVEIEGVDGSRVIVPSMWLHTEVLSHGAGAGRAQPITVLAPLPPGLDPATRQEWLDAARHLALLSPRRAPGSPVLVDAGLDGAMAITMTPFHTSEAPALRAELRRRLTQCLAATPDHAIEGPTRGGVTRTTADRPRFGRGGLT